MAEDLDKNQAATPYKLEQARKRGSVAKSADVIALIVFVAGIVFLGMQGNRILEDIFVKCRALLLHACDFGAGAAGADRALAWMGSSLFDVLLPVLLVIVIAGVLGNIIQNGFMFTIDPIKPDWSRLNPANGLKKLFSFRSVFDGFRSVVKLLILGAVLYQSLKDQVPIFFRLSQLDSRGYISIVIQSLVGVGFKLALALAVLVVIDVLYTKREFAKQMRMSRKELKDEHKQREGDPRIRSKLRSLRMEFLAKTRSLGNVKNADVVITNPTHLAIALRYEHGVMQSPQVLAKGAGAMAKAIRNIARLNNIPVVENRPLAQKLFREMAVGAYIAPELYADVAKIVVWVFSMRKNQGA